MDKILYDRGLAKRQQVLGDEYVDHTLRNVNDFKRDFQRLIILSAGHGHRPSKSNRKRGPERKERCSRQTIRRKAALAKC
jgi:hypothetical protein